MLRSEKNQQSIEWRQCWRGWGVMRCEATRKIIKATFSGIKRQNGGFGSQSTRSHPQQPAAVWVRLSGAAVANYFYLSLTGPVPLRCFASLEPLLSPNSLMHACFTQISSTCSGSVNISRVAYAIHFECVTPPYG